MSTTTKEELEFRKIFIEPMEQLFGKTIETVKSDLYKKYGKMSEEMLLKIQDQIKIEHGLYRKEFPLPAVIYRAVESVRETYRYKLKPNTNTIYNYNDDMPTIEEKKAFYYAINKAQCI